MTEQQLKEVLAPMGEIFSTKFITDWNDSKNQCFVQFIEMDSANEAIKQLNGLNFGSSKLSVTFANNSNIVYVKGVFEEGYKEKLVEVVQQFGDYGFGEEQVSQETQFYIIPVKMQNET